MIEFTSFASSSAGNLYRVTSGDTVLLLECGLSIKRIRQALSFGLASVAGCLVTHCHMDHAKAAGDLLKAGVDVYTSAGTAKAIGLTGHRLHIIKAGKQFTIGAIRVLPFATEHDAPEPLGFLLADGEDKMAFITDSAYIRWRFKGLTMLAIECNYDAGLLGNLEPSRRYRLLQSHMSLETVKAMLAANDLSRVREIHLLHLSGDHADPERFKSEIEKLTGIPVYSRTG